MIDLRIGSDDDNPVEHRFVTHVAEHIAPEHGARIVVSRLDGSKRLNAAVHAGELDGHTAQQWPALRRIRARHGWDVLPVVPMYVSTVSVFSARHHSLAALRDGAEIAIADEPANQAHALRLLERAGLIELAAGTDPAEASIAHVATARIRWRPVPVAALADAVATADAAVGTTIRLLPAGREHEIALLGCLPAYAKQVTGRAGDAHAETRALIAQVFGDPRLSAFVARELADTERPVEAGDNEDHRG